MTEHHVIDGINEPVPLRSGERTVQVEATPLVLRVKRCWPRWSKFLIDSVIGIGVLVLIAMSYAFLDWYGLALCFALFVVWFFWTMPPVPQLFIRPGEVVYGTLWALRTRPSADVIALQLLRVVPLLEGMAMRDSLLGCEVNLVLADPAEPRVHCFVAKKVTEARLSCANLAKQLQVPLVEQIATWN
jgi:hypothetical protein